MTVVNPSGASSIKGQATNVALINGTQTFWTWTAPNDGKAHIAIWNAYLNITSPQTGGAITLTYTIMGQAQNFTVFPGGLPTQFTNNGAAVYVVDPGTTITLAQTSAQTAGASVLSAVLLAA